MIIDIIINIDGITKMSIADYRLERERYHSIALNAVHRHMKNIITTLKNSIFYKRPETQNERSRDRDRNQSQNYSNRNRYYSSPNQSDNARTHSGSLELRN